MKTKPDAVGTGENEFRCAKHVQEPTPSVPPKASPGAQNMKTGADALGCTENESGSAKHENETRRPRYNRKRVRARKTLKRDPTPSVPPKMSTGS
jgi:hypothetical protein